MKRICALFCFSTLLLAITEGQSPSSGGIYKPNPNPPTDGLVGSNYTPAYAVNQVQFWHDFRPEVVNKELASAKEYFGITTLRVFLHNINFDEEKDVFLGNLEHFLEICDNHGIKPGFVFFDDIHRHSGIFLDEPTEPVKGWHNGRWAACPQDRDRDPENLQNLKPYVQEVIRAHRKDKRVLYWEIFNEPLINNEYSEQLRNAGYKWAKEVIPVQPVISCWNDSEFTDIVDSHNYTWKPSYWDMQADANKNKGTVITEAGARWYAPRPSNGEPCEVLDWLERRRADGESTPGVYLNWELMVGNSNCRWYWETPPDSPEPTFPWCGLMWPDATPVSLAESEASLRYAKGKGRALLFENFQYSAIPHPSGWKISGENEPAGSGVLVISPGVKMTAGNPEWKDYLVESVIMLKDPTGSAGLVLRVNDTGPGKDDYFGYYVGFDTDKLYLGKMNDNDQQILATYDLGRLDCRVVEDVWNHMRVEARGNQLRVWFNRMHPSSDPEKGLRISYTDTDNPFLSGNIGVKAEGTNAWFDNIVVIPLK